MSGAGGPTCPYCGDACWLVGPRGGYSVNIMCMTRSCQHWFNYYGSGMAMEDLNQVGPERRSSREIDPDGKSPVVGYTT